MATNTHLVQRLTAIQAALMAQKAGGFTLPGAMIGSEREVFLREFLQEVFPAHRRFSTGVITDSAGELSGQVDIAVEYGHIPSFPMPGGTKERLLLAESVSLVIEVKSDLSSQWGEVEETTGNIKKLKRAMSAIMTVGQTPSITIPVIAVGYSGHKTSAGLDRRLADTAEECRPDAALVIESGLFRGYGISAHGPLGLYALCLAINSELVKIGVANPNLLPYAQ